MQFILIGAVRYNVPRICAARISPRGPSLALRAIHLVPRLRRPKLDVAVRQPKCGKVLYHAVVKILCRSPFPAYAVYHLHPSYDYKGNGCSKRVETVGVYPFCPRGGRRNAPAVRRRRIPPLRFSEKPAARIGRTRLRQFEYPAHLVQRKEPPRQGEHANAVHVPRLFRAENEKITETNRFGDFLLRFIRGRSE